MRVLRLRIISAAGALATLCYLSLPGIIMQTDTKPESDSLITWFQAGIQQLYDVSQETNIQGVLSGMFDDDASIIANHMPVTLKQLSDQLTARRAATVNEVVEWKDIQDMTVNDVEEGETAASAEEIVAGCYIVTRSFRFRIRVTPAQSKSHVVFSAKVHKDPGNNWKIKQLLETTIDKAVPVFLNVPNISS